MVELCLESSERGFGDPRVQHMQAMNNFTPRAQRVLALARKEADNFNHNFVGTEHLLLGLISLGQGVAVTVLRKLGLDLETVRAEVERQVGTGPEQRVIGDIPYTPRVQKVLALAANEARALNHTYVGTEHILLGLLREGEGVGARVLKKLDVDVGQTRQEILRELDPSYERPASGTGPAETPRQAAAPKAPPEMIDTSKRYDVYCMEGSRMVVYRNAQLMAKKRLFHPSEYAVLAEFLEDGQIVFVARTAVIKLCEHGGTPAPEAL
jgi:ATP-dependent Clp protease ATP-binding subunit ClpA